MTFEPPTITNPTDCTDVQWMYWANLDPSSTSSPFPPGLQVSIDGGNHLFSWGRIPGFIGDIVPGSYLIQVTGVVPESPFQTQEAFTVTIVIDCCASPTIITAPSTLWSAFTYKIGGAAKYISLSAPNYISDNSCCIVPQLQTPTFTPVAPATTPPIGLFDVQTDILIKVLWTDFSIIGPVGDYTVTYQSDSSVSQCFNAPANVEYTMTIENPCF